MAIFRKINYKKFPYTVINNYLSDYLDQQGIMPATIKASDGSDQPTIVPAAQNPELNDSGKSGTARQTAFIVYTLDLDNDADEEWMEAETLVYTIYAPTVSKVLEIVYCMRDCFGRSSASADEINDWQNNEGYYSFLTTNWQFMSGPDAARQEGGRYAARLSVNYGYTYEVETKNDGGVGPKLS